MKNILCFFVLLFFSTYCFAQQQAQVRILSSADSTILYWKNEKIDLGTVQLIPFFISDGFDSCRILDIDDSDRLLVVATTDSVFGNRAILHIFNYKGGQIKSVHFYYSAKNFFEYLIAVHYFIFIDSDNNIYVQSSNQLDKKKEMLLAKIDKYSWNAALNSFSYVKSRLFKSNDRNEYEIKF